MTAPASPERRVAVYLALTLALSSIFWFLIIRAGSMGAHGGAYVYALMWCPAAAAILTSLATGRRLREIGWRWSSRWALAAYAIPVAYGLIAYGATWALGLGSVPDGAFLAAVEARFGGGPVRALGVYLLIQSTVGVLASCASGLGEEIGWRGLLVPELSRRFAFTKTALISGAIWAVWHYPILLFADYNAGTPAWYGLTCFTICVIGIGFVFAYVRLVSGSVWPAAILHGSHNLWIQQVFDPLTGDTGKTPWIIGEFGAALAIVAIGVAWVTARQRRRLGPAEARMAPA